MCTYDERMNRGQGLPPHVKINEGKMQEEERNVGSSRLLTLCGPDGMILFSFIFSLFARIVEFPVACVLKPGRRLLVNGTEAAVGARTPPSSLWGSGPGEDDHF